jgi:hypothetical protein
MVNKYDYNIANVLLVISQSKLSCKEYPDPNATFTFLYISVTDLRMKIKTGYGRTDFLVSPYCKEIK